MSVSSRPPPGNIEDMGRPLGGRGGIIGSDGSGLLGIERLGGGRVGAGGVALRIRTSITRKWISLFSISFL